MDKETFITQIVAPAMKTAVKWGLLRKNVEEDEYARNWNAMERILSDARAPLEIEIEDLNSELLRLRNVLHTIANGADEPTEKARKALAKGS